MVGHVLVNIVISMATVLAFSYASEKETLDLTRVKACFQEQKEKCGDLICEMSTDDLYYVVEQLESNIIDCLETN